MSSEVPVEVMIEQLKKLYIEHDRLIMEHNKLIADLKQRKEDIEMLQTIIMYKSNKESRVL